MHILAQISCRPALRPVNRLNAYRALSSTNHVFQDPRLADIGRVIEDEYAVIRDNYGSTHSIAFSFSSVV